MAKLALKFYKLNPFPLRTLVNNIRKRTWSLRDLIKDIKQIKSDLLHARVEIEHLLLTKSQRPEDHAIANKRIHELRKTVKNSLKAFTEALSKEIFNIKKIDYRGQTIAFRELKDMIKFEKRAIKNLKYLYQKQEKLTKSEEERKKLQQVFSEGTKALETAMIALEAKLNHTLKTLWEMANRQAIDGIEMHALLSSQKQDKQQREIKIEARDMFDLIGEHNSKLKSLNNSKTLEEYVKNFQILVDLFSKELDSLVHMVQELRMFVFDLRGNFKVLKSIEKQLGQNTQNVEELESKLKETLCDLEDIYNWLFHEDRNHHRLVNGEWLKQIESSFHDFKKKDA